MRERIKKIVSHVLNMQNVTDETAQRDCDNWDSLKHLYLIVELEDAFGVSFEPEEIAEMKDIKSIYEIISRKL